MVLNGAEIVTEILKAHGVDIVFDYLSSNMPEIYDALEANRDSICHVFTAHEQSAIYAADGYSGATGKTGVVMAVGVPGGTNIMTGMATAYMDGVPMVAIVSNVFGDMIGANSCRGDITLPIAKRCFAVRKVSELENILKQAFYLAQEGRKGPVLVDVARDAIWSLYDFKPGKQYEGKTEILPAYTEIFKAANMINAARNPVVIYGIGAADSSRELLAFMRKASIPGVHTIMSVSTLPFDEPLNLGMAGIYGSSEAKRAVNSSDLVIGVGTRFSDRLLEDDTPFAPKAKILHIDAASGEISKSLTADMSLIGDVSKILSLLYPFINEKKRRILPVARQRHIIFDMIEELYPDGVYTADVGPLQMMAAKYIRHKSPAHFISSGGLGTMGFGYGAAIGAAMGLGCRVFHITGDDSFYINLIEAATAVTYSVPVISIIFSNRTSDAARRQQPDYIKSAEEYGVKGYSCKNAKEFQNILRETVKYKGPIWIELRLYEGGFSP